MRLLLLAEEQIPKHWWFAFVDHWGNTASVIGLILAVVAFPITWRIQSKIRRETQRAVEKVALMVLTNSLQQALWQLKMTKEAARSAMWQRAFDFCDGAKESALRMLANPHLTPDEKRRMWDHADNLAQVMKYLERNKLRNQNPPPVFERRKMEILESTHESLTLVQVRLSALTWEI
jgi:hypothetical protein